MTRKQGMLAKNPVCNDTIMISFGKLKKVEERSIHFVVQSMNVFTKETC